MTRESVEQKATRYLCEARLTVTRVDERAVAAVCRGAGAVYALGYSGPLGWWCECPARGRCCHLTALQRVVAVRPAESEPDLE